MLSVNTPRGKTQYEDASETLRRTHSATSNKASATSLCNEREPFASQRGACLYWDESAQLLTFIVEYSATELGKYENVCCSAVENRLWLDLCSSDLYSNISFDMFYIRRLKRVESHHLMLFYGTILVFVGKKKLQFLDVKLCETSIILSRWTQLWKSVSRIKTPKLPNKHKLSANNWEMIVPAEIELLNLW